MKKNPVLNNAELITSVPTCGVPYVVVFAIVLSQVITSACSAHFKPKSTNLMPN